MVYLAAILSCGLLVQLLRTTLTTRAVSKLRRSSAKALIPFVGAIALVSAIYSYLSIRVHRQDLNV